MVAPARRAVILIPFPFSDLSQSKLRPAVAIADAGGGDYILCQVTSNPYGDAKAIKLTDSSFESGTLERDSYVRPGKIFTANQALIQSQIGILTTTSFEHIIDGVIGIIRPDQEIL